MQDAFASRHLHIEGRAGFKPVFPVDLEAEKINVELRAFISSKMRKMGVVRPNVISPLLFTDALGRGWPQLHPFWHWHSRSCRPFARGQFPLGLFIEPLAFTTPSPNSKTFTTT